MNKKTNWLRTIILNILIVGAYLVFQFQGYLPFDITQLLNTFSFVLYPLFVFVGIFGEVGSWVALIIIMIIVLYGVAALLEKIISKIFLGKKV